MTHRAADPAGRHAEPRAVVLLSGGLDSATVLALAREQGWECHALTLQYGQRHGVEVERAARLATALGADEHRVLSVDLASFGGSSLVGEGQVPRTSDAPGQYGTEASLRSRRNGTDASLQPGLRRTGDLPRPEQIPSTYVPARNLVFLSIATALAEALDARAVFIGVNALDYSGYPDCRGDFIEAFQKAAVLGTRCGRNGSPIEVMAPLLALTKAQIIALGTRLGVDFALTSSCYAPGPDGIPCGACDSCRLRALGFREAGIPDPALPGSGGRPTPAR